MTPADQLWIGDHDAFEAYQRHFHEPTGMAERAHAETPEQEAFLQQVARGRQPPPPNPFLSEEEHEDLSLGPLMSAAMEDVIADPSANTVAGFTIHVKGDERGFRYHPQAAQFGGFSQTLPAGVETPLRFGKPASAGGYGYTYCLPDPGVGAVGVYFPQGRLGSLFHPLVRDDPILYGGVSQDEFGVAVEKEYSIRLNADFGFR